MNNPNLYMLVSIRDNALIGQWSFQALDELAIARELLRDPWEYQDIFWALRITTDEVQHLEPSELLRAIHDSYPNQKVRAVLYLLRVENFIP